MNDDFVNLHLHTHYSVQDATIKIPDLFDVVGQYGQKAVAITDHGSIEGWNEFYLTSKTTDIKPIFGCEFYCKEHYEKPTNKSQRYHLIVLAKNDNGAKTVNRLQMVSSMKNNFYYKPLLPYPYLFDSNNDDIFISTACALGTVGQCFNKEESKKQPEEAEVFLNKLLDIFGKENVALEFQFHPTWASKKKKGYYPQNYINERLLELWDITDVKYCIATTDAHFIDDPESRRKLQADAWNRLYKDIDPSLKSNCLGTSKKVKEFAKESNFSALDLVDTMIKNTSVVASKCNVDNINNIGGKRILPRFAKQREFKKIFCKPVKRAI